MTVYYKFKSARDYDSIPMDGPFMSVGSLKEKIFESKHLGRGTDFDLLVTNAQTNEEYLDEEMLIPKNTLVLVRRVPGWPSLPIVTEIEQKVENKVVESLPENRSLPAEDISAMKYPEESDWDDFGNDLYSIPDQVPVQSSNLTSEAPPPNKADEDSRIKAFIDTPALDWQRQGSDFGTGRGFGRGTGGQMGGGRGFGMERKTPPQGYICHRCNVPGHFIQHCPTNGDPNFDVRKVKQPTGIPRSMLMVNPQGSYALPNGSVAVLKPNEAAFEKEIEGMPSTRSVGDLPPELHCPLCNDVMKDAVLTSKCCFKSFCDRCIRDYIISKSVCVCGATSILADDLLPNKTLRDTINRILEAGNSSAENAGSTFQVQDTESARCPQPNIPSPTSSAASKGEVQQKLVPIEAGKKKKKKKVRLPPNDLQWKTPHDGWNGAENYMMPMCPPPGYNSYWNGMQPMDGFMAPYGGPMQMMGYGLGPLDMPFAGGGMPHDPFGMQGYMMPAVLPHRDLADFGMGMNVPPPFMSREEFEAPRKADLRRKGENERRPERDFSKDRDFGREVSSVGDISSMKSKTNSILASSSSDYHHSRFCSERYSPDRSPCKLEPPPRPTKRKSDHHSDHECEDRYRDYEHECHRRHHWFESSSKRSSESVTKASSASATAVAMAATMDCKQKASVFSHISFSVEEEPSKKRKVFASSTTQPAIIGADGTLGGSSAHSKAVSNRYYEGRKNTAVVDYESNDDERHFKRRLSRYEPSPQSQTKRRCESISLSKLEINSLWEGRKEGISM